jgi:hypothetical protein
MWFAIGVLTVVLASAGLAWWRGRTAWKGDLRILGVQAAPGTHKNKLVTLEVGVRTPSRLEFDLKPETVIDRWAKGIGLSVEGEVGNGRFDEALYLVADDPNVVGALRRDRALADALLALFGLAGGSIVKVKRVRCRGGWLRVSMKTDATGDSASTITSSVAPDLKAAADALGTTGTSARPDPLWWRSTALVALAGGLAANAAVNGLRAGIGGLPETLDNGAIWTLALPVGLVGVVALVAATLLLLGRSSRAHLVLLEVLLIGAPGAIGTAAVELRDLNIEADTSAATTHDSAVQSRREHRSRKGGRSYSVTLREWPGSDGPVDFKVSSGEYSMMTPGTPVEVQVRDGYLGWEWLESYRRVRR